MKNIMKFDDGYKAVIAYDPEIDIFRGEFVGLNGGADFYASDLEGLRREGETTLRVFLDECEKRGLEPRKKAGNFALRLDPELYHQASVAAASADQSLNTFIANAIRQSLAKTV